MRQVISFEIVPSIHTGKFKHLKQSVHYQVWAKFSERQRKRDRQAWKLKYFSRFSQFWYKCYLILIRLPNRKCDVIYGWPLGYWLPSCPQFLWAYFQDIHDCESNAIIYVPTVGIQKHIYSFIYFNQSFLTPTTISGDFQSAFFFTIKIGMVLYKV